jgi:4-diphosphocytidyl-2-C-methyl-D-erythritol kinase
MLSAHHAGTLVVRAPAKVNLHLEVRAKRTDGYHDVETLMVAVSLHDTLEFMEEPAGNLRLSCDQPSLSVGPDNLVWRAAALLRQHTGCRTGATIRLTKRIPLAAGLAGGSSDAAATLAGLNRFWRLGLPRRELAELGSRLGSDIAFFFFTPAAWCTGRGERVAPVRLGRWLRFVMVCPPAGLSTADVYRGVTVPEKPWSGDAIRAAVGEGKVQMIGRRLFNRLQPVAERLCPAVAALRRRLEKARPTGHLMSGSGTSLFALCRDRGEALRVARRLRTEAEEGATPRVFLVHSCS